MELSFKREKGPSNNEILSGYPSVFDALPDTPSTLDENSKNTLKNVYESFSNAWTIPDLYKSIRLAFSTLEETSDEGQMKKNLFSLSNAVDKVPSNDLRGKTVMLVDLINIQMINRIATITTPNKK